ncbi:SCO family protein [Bacillus sp. FSL W7-1360]
MKGRTHIFIIASCALLIIFSGCSWMYEVGHSSEFDATEAGLTVPDFSYTNQENEPFSRADLDGQYWLASFAFTSCTTVCLTMIPNMRYLQTQLQKDNVNIHFVTFSVDPEKDTPAHLKQYTDNINAATDQWSFLTGYDVETIVDFSAEGFRSPVAHGDTPEEVVHSTSFFLINGDHEVVRRYNGLELDQSDIIADIKQTVQ